MQTTMKTGRNRTMPEPLNGIDVEALRDAMARVKGDPGTGMAAFHVTTTWMGGTRSETRVDDWTLGGKTMDRGFTIAIDEPAELMGTNTAANPQEYLMAAANACMMNTYVMACAMNGITLESVTIEMTGELDLRGFMGLNAKIPPGYGNGVSYTVRIKGDGTPEQFEQMHQWVMKTSPNYWNMANPIHMNPTLVVE